MHILLPTSECCGNSQSTISFTTPLDAVGAYKPYIYIYIYVCVCVSRHREKGLCKQLLLCQNCLWRLPVWSWQISPKNLLVKVRVFWHEEMDLKTFWDIYIQQSAHTNRQCPPWVQQDPCLWPDSLGYNATKEQIWPNIFHDLRCPTFNNNVIIM